MYNALFSDNTRDDFKKMARDIRTISEKLKSQVTSGEEGIDYIWRFYWTPRKSETSWYCVDLHGTLLLEIMKEKWNDNTYVYSRWKTDIRTHIYQVLSFAG